VFASANAVSKYHFLYGTSGQEVVYKYVSVVRALESETDNGSEYIFKADLHLMAG
jgi:hypothetical protein